MLKKIVLTVAIIVAAFVLLLTQPWSQYPPIAMMATFDAETRSHNFRNMDDIYPHVAMPAATTPMPYPEMATDLEMQYSFDGEELDLSAYLERT
ncbi:MAG: hypothetical protein KAR62_04220, partial [Sphingomonadales bacterium]|nr:hypothetical protein [Sphingomonadales bacterium]